MASGMMRGFVLWAALAIAIPARPSDAEAQTGAPPPAVTVATVKMENVAPASSFIGRVIAIQSVQIVARVTAYIDNVPVQQGSDVTAGQVMYQLQTSQYEADVKSAQAQVESAQAGLRNAQVTYDRANQLNRQGFEATSNLDTAIANRDQAQASVLTAQANLALAALNLSYCTIKSPIDGRIGAITLTKGNLVTPSTPALATVNQLDPIRVVFSVSNREVVQVEQRTGNSSAEIAAGLVLSLMLPDGTKYPEPGRIAFLSNEVDQSTGTVSVYGDFPNPKRLLLPGAFVNVDVREAKPDDEILAPLAAVQTEQKGSYVLVVGADNKVVQQPVETGRQVAQRIIISKGLKAGERVIVEGVQKVRAGQVVSATEAQDTPTPPGQASPASSGG